MGSARDRIFGNTDSSDEPEHASVKIGARMARHQVAFLPSGGGRGVSLEYGLLQFIEFERDYSGLVLYFLTHQVTVEGRGLKGLLDQLKGHLCELVEAADPLHAAAGLPRFDVTAVRVEPVEG